MVVATAVRSRETRPVFDASLEQLRWAIGRVLQIDPRATIGALDPELAREVSAAMSALAGRVDAGATDTECLWELQNLAGLLRRSVPGDFVSLYEAQKLPTSMLQQYRDAGPNGRAEIRARVEDEDLSQSP